MKKKLFSILAIGAIAITACKKEEPTTVSLGTATIEGVIFAPLDYGNDTTAAGVFTAGLNNEFAPSGTLITAIIDTEDLQANPQAGYTYEKIIKTTTIGENGAFSFSDIPANSKTIAVTLKFNDFKMIQGQNNPTVNPDEEKIFTLGDQMVSVYQGAITIKEFTYND